MKTYRLLLPWFAALGILHGCSNDETRLQSELKPVDRAVFRQHALGQVHQPITYVNADTLALLKEIPFGEKSPAMKCNTEGILVFMAGNDTVLDISLTLQQGCMTATFKEGEQLKSVWLDAKTFAILTAGIQKAGAISGLNKLKWMLGKWTQTEPDGKVSFETWQENGPNSFSGHAFTLKGRDTVFQEQLEVLEENGSIYYVANVVENAGPVRFKLMEYTATSATFENKAHDFPQIITYVAKGDSGIVASISGLKNGQFGRSEFPLKRVDK